MTREAKYKELCYRFAHHINNGRRTVSFADVVSVCPGVTLRAQVVLDEIDLEKPFSKGFHTRLPSEVIFFEREPGDGVAYHLSKPFSEQSKELYDFLLDYVPAKLGVIS